MGYALWIVAREDKILKIERALSTTTTAAAAAAAAAMVLPPPEPLHPTVLQDDIADRACMCLIELLKGGNADTQKALHRYIVEVDTEGLFLNRVRLRLNDAKESIKERQRDNDISDVPPRQEDKLKDIIQVPSSTDPSLLALLYRPSLSRTSPPLTSHLLSPKPAPT